MENESIAISDCQLNFGVLCIAEAPPASPLLFFIIVFLKEKSKELACSAA